MRWLSSSLVGGSLLVAVLWLRHEAPTASHGQVAPLDQAVPAARSGPHTRPEPRLPDAVDARLELDAKERAALALVDDDARPGARFAARQRLADSIYRERAAALIARGVSPDAVEAAVRTEYGDPRDAIVLDTLTADDDAALAAELIAVRSKWRPTPADLAVDRATIAALELPAQGEVP